MHVPEMEPPDLSRLVLDELAWGQYELVILEVIRAIRSKGPDWWWCLQPV